MPTYTFTQKTPPTNPESNFAGVATDGNRVAMTGALGSGIQTQDATATPVTSPVTVATTGVTTLTVPANATQLVLHSTTTTAGVSVKVSEVSNLASYTLVSNSDGACSFDVARQGFVYLQAVSASDTVAFHFSVV